MIQENAPVQQLTAEQSWSFLTGQQVSRLAVFIGDEPHIVPINHLVTDGGVVFRTGEGSKLLAVALGGRLALEADSWDGENGTSVIAHGTARELEGAERDAAEDLPLRPWVGTRKTHFIRIDVDQISGRRFTFGAEDDEPTWA